MMHALIAIAGLSLAFTFFALLGPAEKYRPCRGAEPGKKRCGQCALGAAEEGTDSGCPGKRALPSANQGR